MIFKKKVSLTGREAKIQVFQKQKIGDSPEC